VKVLTKYQEGRRSFKTDMEHTAPTMPIHRDAELIKIPELKTLILHFDQDNQLSIDLNHSTITHMSYTSQEKKEAYQIKNDTFYSIQPNLTFSELPKVIVDIQSVIIDLCEEAKLLYALTQNPESIPDISSDE